MDAHEAVVLGALVGALASGGTAWLTTTATRRSQEAQAERERAATFNAFQRTTLLDLQEALHDLVRMLARAHAEQRGALHRNVHWDAFAYSVEVSEGLRLASARLALLVERVASDDLRKSVKTFTAGAALRATARSYEAAEHEFFDTVADVPRLQEPVGAALRRTY